MPNNEVPKDVKPLSDAIAGPIEKLYTIGGLQLVFMFVGTILMVLSAIWSIQPPAKYVVLAIGALLVLTVMVIFFITNLMPLRDAQKTLKQQKQLIDTVQNISLETLSLADSLQTIAISHANHVAGLLQEYGPAIKQVPIIGKKLSDRIDTSENLAVDIVVALNEAHKTLTNVETAIRNADATHLKAYVDDLQGLRTTIENLRSKRREIAAS